MPDNPENLTPADMEELVQSLAFALQYDGRRRTHDADRLVARVAAARLVEHLRKSRYVILKRPPAPPHSDTTHRKSD